MDIHIGARVDASDGGAGEVTRVVVEPQGQRQVLTHLVVRGQGVLGVERLVPIEDVIDATPERLVLRLSRAQVDNLPPFERTVEYTPPGVDDRYLDTVRDEEQINLEDQDIDESAAAVRGGERVEATDGAIGRVDDVIIDQASSVVTHLMLREGHLWQTRTVTIPVDVIDRIERGVIYLKLSKSEVEPLSRPANA